MGMYGILITLSPKRLAQLTEEPETLEDVIDARHEQAIPGLLDIGKAWDALDVMLSERGRHPVLSDVVLARSGTEFDMAEEFGKARVLTTARVAEIARTLGELPPTIVRDRFGALAKSAVHGKFGNDPDEIDDLEIILARVVQLYQEAAKSKHSMMAIVTVAG